MPIARRVWADLQDPRGSRVRFEHDHYLKLWLLTSPRLSFDVVMLDEAHDSNPVTAHLVTSQEHAHAFRLATAASSSTPGAAPWTPSRRGLPTTGCT